MSTLLSVAPPRPKRAAERYIRMMRFGNIVQRPKLQKMEADAATVDEAIERMLRKELIKRSGSSNHAWRRLPVPDQTYEPMLPRTKAWIAMRIFAERHQEFSAPELLERLDGDHQSTASVTSYINSLIRTGYLERTPRHTHRLIRNTGPLAPIRRRRSVYDPNVGGEHDV